MAESNRSIGTHYEEVAEQYLTGQGYLITEKNFRWRQGEIDIVAKDGEYLCFIEVKYRKNLGKGHPLEAVDHRKQQKIIQTAGVYMAGHHTSPLQKIRFDVVSILGDEVSLYKNAFGNGW